MLFDIIVQPIIYILELAFSLLFELTQTEGAAIIGVSILVNLFCMPLYRMADEHQDQERQRQKSMERWVTHIKQNFSKDERFMMLNAYYREQGYHPAKALVGSLSLLFQIPFFMAAYTYLSNLDLLRGAQFLFLNDLASPDRLIVLGPVVINVLPVAMTLLNCVSTAIYTRGLALRDKLQAYILAALFLVLLYNSPSGLVLYWTCNQIFSLGKNVFTKMVPNYREWALLLADVAVLAGLVWVLANQKVQTGKDAAFVIAIVGAAVWGTVRRVGGGDKTSGGVPLGGISLAGSRTATAQFFLGAAFLSLLLGVLIPSGVLASSPSEFVNVHMFVDPLAYVGHSLCVWGGLFVLWLGTYYLLSDTAGRRRLSVAVWCLCAVFLLDYFVFLPHFGTLSIHLVFDEVVVYPEAQMLASLAVTVGFALLLGYVWFKLNSFVVPTMAILCAALVVLSVPNIVKVRQATNKKLASADYRQSDYMDEDGGVKPLFSLSRTGKNVVVLFLDRAISGYVPFIMNERPELLEQFDGFTYYPNTISYGRCTNFGSPALYGGYEYTPAALNERTEESLADKHNEALLVLPTLLNWLEYDTTIINPAYAGTYSETTDLSLFDALEHVNAYDLRDVYTQVVDEEYGIPATDEKEVKQSFFFYSLFEAVPEFLREDVYDDGDYHVTSLADPPTSTFMSEWSVLHLLPELTEITEEGNTYLNLRNNTTHQPALLQLPDYEPSEYTEEDDDMSRFVVDGKQMLVDTEPRLSHYHANITSFIQLGRWFDWMKEQGVYDNTRIIIVSDHGFGLSQFPGQWVDDKLNIEMVNPLFMVKNFDSHGFTTSDDFMTNADTPVIALREVLNGPVNPYTQKPITDEEKYLHEQYVATSNLWDTLTNNGNVFDSSDEPWYAVSNNIFDINNWRRIDE